MKTFLLFFAICLSAVADDLVPAANEPVWVTRDSTNTLQRFTYPDLQYGSHNIFVFNKDNDYIPTGLKAGTGIIFDLSAKEIKVDASALGLFTQPSGTTAQYVRGDGSLATFPSIPSAQVNSDWNAGSGLAQILNKPTLGTAAAQNVSAFDAAGAAASAQAASQPLDSDLTAIAALTTTAFGRGLLDDADAAAVRASIGAGTGSGSVTSVALSSMDLSVSGSPITTSGTITANLTTTGVSAGTYNSVTVDTKGRVTAATTRSFTNNPSVTLVTSTSGGGVQLSSTRDCSVSYTVTITANASGILAGAQAGYDVLEICATNSNTPGDWIEISRITNGQSINSLLTLASTQPVGAALHGFVPAGFFRRVRSVNTTGTPSHSYTCGQEVLH